MGVPTDEQLAEWRRLADSAAPGPWHVEHFQRDGVPYSDVTTGPADDPGERFSIFDRMEPSDYEFIAAAREALPALLDEVARLRAERWERVDYILFGERQ